MTPQELSHTTRPSKSPNRLMKLLSFIMVSLLIWACVTLWEQMGQFSAKGEQLAELKAKLDETNKVHDDLKREIARLNDPEYKEEKARKELRVAKPGETIFDLPN
ncbi:FtsB family cell division protein [Paenibacillus contaminans]|nr:septum formation initiator family protein [Paenibacillus contaminans]